jgi:hypothetical protein
MEKIYTTIPTSIHRQPKKESIDWIKAFAASYRANETNQQITMEAYLN